jgi:tetratricopeptide (TPR) repeat protein
MNAIEHLLTGYQRHRKDNYQGAIVHYSDAIAVDPDFFFAYFQRGNCYKEIGELDQALADFSEAIRLQPDYVELYGERGGLKLALENASGAAEDFERRKQLSPHIWLVKSHEATNDEELGRILNEGIRLLTIAETIDTDWRSLIGKNNMTHNRIDNGADYDLYLDRARLRERQGDLHGALHDYEYFVRFGNTYEKVEDYASLEVRALMKRLAYK